LRDHRVGSPGIFGLGSEGVVPEGGVGRDAKLKNVGGPGAPILAKKLDRATVGIGLARASGGRP
jgi:hypothetical protein